MLEYGKKNPKSETNLKKKNKKKKNTFKFKQKQSDHIFSKMCVNDLNHFVHHTV